MESNSTKNKRIAKNTFVLYLRMLFLMAIHLYTSRVILEALGVEDFGIYNVVGGFVAMFAVLTQSLSAAASRFFNYEMASGDRERLSKVFSTTLIIHIALAAFIAFLAEGIGIWFVNDMMVIPADRLNAANWVFQFSVLAFCLNLITVPYHAVIIAHERMNVFAYISIFEGISSLLICYLLYILPIDRLVFYAILIFLIRVSIMVMNQLYCKKHFAESIFKLSLEKSFYKEIFGFASWNMIGAASGVLRNQGGNILLNLFFGPVVNAARAVANQVLRAVNSFVDNFMMAMNPQITQSYASGDHDYMMDLIYKGSRYSFYMLLFICLPILINTDYILSLWLNNVPEHSSLFVQLTLIYTMIESISRPLVTAQLATGRIRNYQIVVGGLQLLNLPISYLLLRLGGIPEVVLYVAIVLSIAMLLARLYMLRSMIQLKALNFVKEVLFNIVAVSFFSAIFPLIFFKTDPGVFFTFCISVLLCCISCVISVYYIGFSKSERIFVRKKLHSLMLK